MDELQAALTHINASVSDPIDCETMIACIDGTLDSSKWTYHVLTFFLETPLPRVHDMVLAGVFSFEKLYLAHQKWDATGYAENETTWIDLFA